jgi:carbon storage regulator
MLVLSRRKDERIVIGGSIVITVIEVKGDKVRLGIEAPKEVSVHRQEVHAAIAEEQRLAEAEAIRVGGAPAPQPAVVPALVPADASTLGPDDRGVAPSSATIPASERRELPPR